MQKIRNLLVELRVRHAYLFIPYFLPKPFSTEGDLLFPLLNFSIPSFPQGHSLAAQVFFLNFPSLQSCLRTNAEGSQQLTNLMHKIFFYNKFITHLYMFRALCAHHQEVKIVLYSIWYHHTITSSLNLCTGRPPTGVMIPDARNMQRRIINLLQKKILCIKLVNC